MANEFKSRDFGFAILDLVLTGVDIMKQGTTIRITQARNRGHSIASRTRHGDGRNGREDRRESNSPETKWGPFGLWWMLLPKQLGVGIRLNSRPYSR